ncbi:MAG TPA: BrnT family toxin [Vineibacter sp.]|nr:BrnT family toxin [Vineibacter sp.]
MVCAEIIYFEWDREKARSNAIKHGVTFELAQRVWDDPLYVVVPDRVVDGEQRWHAIGVVGSIVTLLVVHTYPDPDDEDRVRIIGARKATSHERRRYEQEGA